MSPSWIWSDKITNERVARVGYNHFISNKGEWNNCFSKFSNPVLPPIFISTILQSGKFVNLAHYFPCDVKLRILADSRSFLANQKARNAIVGAENLLNAVMQNLDAIIGVRMMLCETSMLLFVSVWCYAKPGCYYWCPYGVMQNLEAIIRVYMVLCKTSMLLFVSVWCYAKPRCYYSYGVMRNLDAIIPVRMVLCKTSMLLFVSRIMFVLIRVFRELHRYGLGRVII